MEKKYLIVFSVDLEYKVKEYCLPTLSTTLKDNGIDKVIENDFIKTL